MTQPRGGPSVDVAVVGGGIAGMSAAFFLSQALPDTSIAVFEAEATLTHHTTGRSAAVYIENYGALTLRPLTIASRSFFWSPPEHLVDGPLLTAKGLLSVAPPERVDEARRQAEVGQAISPEIRLVDPEAAVDLVAMLRPELVGAAVYEPGAADIDVAGLHQAFVRGFRANGGQIFTTNRVDSATPQGRRWSLATTEGPVTAGTVINCAGAWGDVVASSAGVAPVGLVPKRRTAFMVQSPFVGSERWPLLAHIDHDWYANPDGPQFLCSPADETPSEPCDAKPEEIDIAIAIERINAATTLDIRSVASSWAGLRTFSPDNSMVIGPDPEQSSFFWCVGQGGTGIQTSPGAGQLVADLVADGRPGSAFEGAGLQTESLSPSRFRA